MIEIKNAKTRYIHGRSFSYQELCFEEGKITSVIGKNGSGKSTLLKMIIGMLRYDGNVMIGNSESRDLSARKRSQRVAYLPQILKTPRIDVETLVFHGRYPWHGSFRRMSGRDTEFVQRALYITGMEAYRHRLLCDLSGGERQRAYLAMVIAQDTPMILLDEPMTYMDMAIQKRILDILYTLAKDGYGIIMVSHNIEQSFSCSDTVCLLHEGNVMAFDPPEELAKQEDLLYEVFGTKIKKSKDKELLYPYVAVK